jgi:hypothetical protein
MGSRKELREGKQGTEAGNRSKGGKQGADPEMGSRERIQEREARENPCWKAGHRSRWRIVRTVIGSL